MLAALARPAPLPLAAASAFAICSAITFYCLAYSALAGRAEPLDQAFAWAVINVLPWLVAFEIAKRGPRLLTNFLVLLGALLASLLLGSLAGGALSLAFEAVRRLPALLLTAGLIFLVRFGAGRKSSPIDGNVDLPWPPQQIDWVNAAGNYIEIKGLGRTVVRRASLSAAERALQGHGFVRIHRSILVRRAFIARVRPADILLSDGTHLKTGKRYRSALSD